MNQKTLDALKGLKILVIGDLMLDRYWWGSVTRISPEAPVPIVRLEDSSVVAGGAANVAVNLKGLGVTPLLFGVTGRDDEADLLSGKLRGLGISTEYISAVEGRPTTIKTRIVAHGQHVVRIDQESVDHISDQTADEILATAGTVVGDVDAVIVSDYAKGLLTDYLLERLIAEARGKGTLVFVDPKRRDFSKYKGANVITPNRREAEEAFSLTTEQPEPLEIAGGRLRADLALDALLITEGENGMTLFEAGGSSHLGPIAHDVFDVTGAGDTVIAAFAAAVASGSSYLDAATLANVAAGSVVGKIGTTAIETSMIEEFLSTHGG